MATYRQRAPDGNVYQIEGPEGATDDEVRAQIMRQMAPPDVPPPPAQAVPEPQQPQGSTFQRYVTQPLWKASDAIAPSLTDILSMAGTGGAGAALRAAPRVIQAIGRTAGAAGGAAGGAALSGENPGQAALGAGAITGAMEAILPAGGALVRALPGMKGRIAGHDAARFGQTLENLSPPLAGARTAPQLHDLASGEGLRRLGAAKEVATQQIEQRIGNAPLTLPSLSQQPMTFREANEALSEIGARAFSRNPLDRNILGVDQRKLYGSVTRDISRALARMDVDYQLGLAKAREEFVTTATRKALPPARGETIPGPARMFAAGRETRVTPQPDVVEREFTSAWPVDIRTPRSVTESVVTTRDVTPSYTRTVVGSIPPPPQMSLGTPAPPEQASGMWDAAQSSYRQGLALLKGLERPNAVRKLPEGMQFNTPAMQRWVSEPRVRAALERKLGPAGYEELVNSLTRGGGVGTVDILAPGSGGPMDALRQVYGRGQGGAPQILGSLIRTGLPNIGSQYAGRAPYSVGAAGQTLADLLGISLTGEMQ